MDHLVVVNFFVFRNVSGKNLLSHCVSGPKDFERSPEPQTAGMVWLGPTTSSCSPGLPKFFMMGHELKNMR